MKRVLILVAHGELEVFGETVRDVDSIARDAAVGPESKGLEEIGADLGVFPVKVGLGGVEDVEVELTVPDGFPGGAAKVGLPVCGWEGVVGSEAYGSALWPTT